MTLFTATLIFGIILLIKGYFWLKKPEWTQKMSASFLREPKWAYLMMAIAGSWFLYKILNLSEADFGEYSNILFLLFAAVIIGSFIYVKDFLAVRGWAIAVLLLCDLFLDAAYMAEPWQKIFLVAFLYLLILEALYFGTVPYKLRDFFNWVYANKTRPKYFAYGFLAYGTLLTIVAFTY